MGYSHDNFEDPILSIFGVTTYTKLYDNAGVYKIGSYNSTIVDMVMELQ